MSAVTLTLPDGRTLCTHSSKRWHVICESSDTVELVRVTSSDVRSRALAMWRALTRQGTRAWVLDVRAGIERAP